MAQVVQTLALDLPPARDFLLSAGFGGVAAVLAAVIVLGAALYVSRRAGKRSLAESDQRDRHHEEQRSDAQHAVAVARCWDRWWQVLETAAIEPSASEGATLGLGPEVALELLRGLLRDAEELGDDTLVKAVAVYQEQLLLVLAQQNGPLSRLAAVPTSTNGGSKHSPPSPDKQAPSTEGPVSGGSGTGVGSETGTVASPELQTAGTPSATQEETTGRRRRR